VVSIAIVSNKTLANHVLSVITSNTTSATKLSPILLPSKPCYQTSAKKNMKSHFEQLKSPTKHRQEINIYRDQKLDKTTITNVQSHMHSSTKLTYTKSNLVRASFPNRYIVHINAQSKNKDCLFITFSKNGKEREVGFPFYYEIT